MNKQILEKLYPFSDEKYKIFNFKIVRTKKTIIGVRIPILKTIVKDILKNDVVKFINSNRSDIYELLMIEGLLIANCKLDIKVKIDLMYKYLDKIDSWALVDSFIIAFKDINKYEDLFLSVIAKLLNSKKEFFVRTALVILLCYYVKEEKLSYIFNIANTIKNDDYYIFMANAWLISVCMAKYPKETKEYFLNNKLDKKTHNKAISKCTDSFRVSKQDKLYLKSLRK